LFSKFLPSKQSRLLSSVTFGLLAVASGAMAQTVPILQPGAPGQAPKQLTPQEAVRVADTRFSPDDVRFMQDMIHHHHQAVQMALVKERGTAGVTRRRRAYRRFPSGRNKVHAGLAAR